ncbi:MarR family winged helix-turn-helix transcriptional regulator [Jatrophihabitans sp. DSM 45814]
MTETVDDIARTAGALRASLGLMFRRMRQVHVDGELSLPETSALARLDRDGSSTPTVLAGFEQISPQSMGATLAGLEAKGLVSRGPDALDGRRVVLSITEAGRQTLLGRRRERTELMAQALASHFTESERKQLLAVAPLLERLAQAL